MRLMIGFVLAACFSMSPALAKDAKAATAAKKAPAKVVKKKVAKHAAKRKGKFQIRLLTYTQVAKLSKAKRAKYIQDMRALLIYLEGTQRQYEVADNRKFEELKEQIALLMQWMSVMPEAHAEPGSWRTSATAAQLRLADVTRYAKAYPQHVGSGWTCGTGLEFNVWAGTCYLLNSTGTTQWSAPGTASGEFCPTNLGFKEVMHSENSAGGGGAWIQVQRACVPNASWALLSPERQAAVLNGQRLEANTFAGDLTDAQTALVKGGSGVSVDVASVGTSGVTPDPAATPPATAAAEGGDGVVTDPAATGVGTSSAIGAPVPGEGTEIDGGTPAAAGTGACTPPVLACKSLTAQQKTEAITRFRSNGRDDDRICIAGGFLQRYPDRSKASGTCRSISALPYLERFGDNQPKCAANRAMCNPVAFCMSTEQTIGGAKKQVPMMFCVSKAREADGTLPLTKRCNDEYARMMRGEPRKNAQGQPVAGEIVEGLPGIVPNKCDPFSFQGLPIQEEWNKLVADTQALVTNWCTDKNPDLQALFCLECEIIMEKMAAMNAAAGTNNCAPAAGTPPAGVTEPPPGGASPAINEGAPDPDADVE